MLHLGPEDPDGLLDHGMRERFGPHVVLGLPRGLFLRLGQGGNLLVFVFLDDQLGLVSEIL